MRHDRHYTLEEARALLLWVSERIVALREALIGASGGNGGGEPGKAVGEAFVELRAGVAEFADREIVLPDCARAGLRAAA